MAFTQRLEEIPMLTRCGAPRTPNTLSGLLVAAALAAALPAQAALHGRDLNGSPNSFEAYYDDVLNITWLADWNYAKTSGFDSDGAMVGEVASVDWIGSLNAGTGLYGFKDWRLPSVAPSNGVRFRYQVTNNASTDWGFAKTGIGWGTASEMGHMFYVTLGNKGFCMPNDLDRLNANTADCPIQPGHGLVNTGPFSNMQTYYYWSGTPEVDDDERVWAFNFGVGYQSIDSWRLGRDYAVAVRNGDVLTPVPEPGMAALMLAGLGGLGVLSKARCRR
jgi:hypothetical protein